MLTARIGIIYPDDGYADSDFEAMTGPEVAVHLTRNAGWSPTLDGGEVDPVEGLQDHLSGGHLEDAATRLARISPDVLAFGCLSCSFAGGPGYDATICKMLAQVGNCPATTGTTALIHAVRALGVTRVALASLYDANRNEMLETVLGEVGVECVGGAAVKVPKAVTDFYESLGMRPGGAQVRTPETSYHLGRMADCPEAEAVVITSTGTRTVGMIGPLERDLGKPVLTANQVLVWHAMQLAGVRSATDEHGRLFALPA